MSTRIPLVVSALLLTCRIGYGQRATDNVRLFQTFFQDAPIAETAYGEGVFQYSTFQNANTLDLGAQGAFPVGPKMQLGAGLAFMSISPDEGKGQSGITDLVVSGRYDVLPGATSISVGALATLPIGSEDIGQGSFDFTGFGSLRHHLPSDLVITGSLALEFTETETVEFDPVTYRSEKKTKHESGLLIAGGIIYPTQGGLNIIGELNIRTEGEYILLSGGLDYPLAGGGRIRGGIGIGLDDGAPDFTIRAGYLLGF